jgi:hypothetical protein
MRIAILLALAACNRLLDLHEPRHVDAPIDAPTECPPFGELPRYSDNSVQLFELDDGARFQRATATDFAIAVVNYPTFVLLEGPVDGPLAPSSLSILDYVSVRLDPDGQTLYALAAQPAFRVDTYHRNAGTWTFGETVLDSIPGFAISTIARIGDEVRLLVIEANGTLHEWRGQSGAWREMFTQTVADLAIDSYIAFPDLSPDGLRMILEGYAPGATFPAMFYTDRATVDQRFGAAQPFPIPIVGDVFITADCMRLYYSGLDRVFYSERIP